MKNILFVFRTKDNKVTLRAINIPGFEQCICDYLRKALDEKYCVYFNNDFPNDLVFDLVILPNPCFYVSNMDKDRMINIPAEMFSTLNIQGIINHITAFWKNFD